MEIKNILDSIKTLINDSKASQQDVFELTEVVDIPDNEKSVKNKSVKDDKTIDTNIKKLLEIKNKVTADTTITNNNTLSALEEVVIEMLKPQITNWLNLNLNKIVDKIVENEIQKILTHDKKSNS